ncbi:restriction endonuclease subunit S [Algoriphagus sp. C2-6-M1]|uniref:restriction endonuclease subunit S n=1 Tax=Algoriphagus persicinus TaxID=3108754 RepID=UPI002B3FDEAD|nr:restriction endonuclease subunit S [Algoriphagus sp. C2-6-M1]MEB2782151.1 restriction endonuclease subunit S [Algoriphagus sp. C2-6-M1]
MMEIATNTTFQKYPAYKDSGEYWMGDIPEYWEIKKLKHVFREKKKITNPSLNCGSISFGKVVYKDDEKIPESTKASYQEVLAGEYLVNPLNLNYDLISLRIGLSDINVVVSSGYIVLKSAIELDKSYFNYLLNRYDVAYMKLLGSGVRQTISFNHIANSLLAYPPKEEQIAIATFLDDKTAKIDRAIAQKEQLIALLKERKQIIIQNAVTKGLPAEERVKAGLDSNVKMKDSGVEWIGEIPEHWEVIPIRRLVDVRDGTHDTPEYIDEFKESFHLITSKDFKGDEIDFSNAKSISKKDFLEISKRSAVQSGDVIMSMIGGNIGKSVIANDFTDYAIKNVGLFKTQGNIQLSKFIRYYLQSGLLDIQIEINSRGGAQGFLSLGDLRNLKFFKIPSTELIEIIKNIETQSTKIHQAISLQQTQIEKLKEYKATLIDSAVTGEIKVT